MPFPAIVFGATAAGVAAYDIRTGRLPRAYSAALTALAAVLTVALPGNPAALLTQGTLAGVIASGFLFTAWLLYPKGIGFGDILYVFPVAFMLGATRTQWTVLAALNDVIWMLLVAFAAAICASLLLRSRRIRFGPCLFTGWALIATFGPGATL